MLEQALLSEQFRVLLAKEQEVAKCYAELIDKVEDPRLRQQVARLCRDKNRHVRLAERLLEIVP